jgi:hypothetical protein
MNQSPPFRSSSLNVASTLRVNPQALWKVTLGFLPAFANLHKRLNGPQEDFSDDGEDSSYLARKKIHFVEIGEDIPEVASVSDISDSSYSEYSSSSSYSEYTSASSGWSNKEYSSCYSSSFSTTCDSKSRAATEATFSGSFYDFARNPHGKAREKTDKQPGTTRWVKKFSRIILGGTRGGDCNHTV